MTAYYRALFLAPAFLAAVAIMTGCASQPKNTDSGAGVTEVTLEAPTIPTTQSPGASAQRDAELAELRAQNAALGSELDRIQSKNRAYSMELARVRESGMSSSASMASPPPMTDSAPTVTIAPESGGGSGGSLSPGSYTVQTASYSNNDKGRRAAEKLCDYFRQSGYNPATFRESGKYLIVLIGEFGSKEAAKSARDQIATLDFNGRRGDFASASVRKN